MEPQDNINKQGEKQNVEMAQRTANAVSNNPN